LVLTNTDAVSASYFISVSINTVVVSSARITDANSVVLFYTFVIFASVIAVCPKRTITIFIGGTVLSSSSLLLASSSLVVAESFEVAGWNWNYLSVVSTTASWNIALASLVNDCWIASNFVAAGESAL